MNIQEAVNYVNTILFTNTGNHLNNIQTAIARGSLEGLGYKQIAAKNRIVETDECRWQVPHIKQTASQLWRILTEVLGETVTKGNFKSVIERQLQGQNSAEETYQLREDWGDAPDRYSTSFYGRTEELSTVKRLIINERCRLITIFGMAGIGKTTLAIKFAQETEENFDYIIWRSLLPAPPVKEILSDLIKFLSNQTIINLPDNINGCISILIDYLRNERCLLILDNAESILQDCLIDRRRDDCEGYQNLLTQIGTVNHQSCLLITSREKFQEIEYIENRNKKVSSLALEGLKEDDILNLFPREWWSDNLENRQALIEIAKYFLYNPFILNQASYLIQNDINGDIQEFCRALRQGELPFRDIGDILQRQFERLSDIEKKVMFWLAINQETISFEQLLEDLRLEDQTVTRIRVIASINNLDQRRPLIERNTLEQLMLQPVIFEYAINEIIEKICEEIKTGNLDFLKSYALLQAQAKVYIKDTQRRLILQPIIDKLLREYGNRENLENRLCCILDAIRNDRSLGNGYAVGNILNLLVNLNSTLNNYNFSDLPVYQADLSNANLHHFDFSYAQLEKCLFRETFSNILTVAFSPDGEFLATGDGQNEIHLWQVRDRKKVQTFRGHEDWVKKITFSPDGRLLASASGDRIIKLWNVETGNWLNDLSSHTQRLMSITFSSDGEFLASVSEDRTVKLWKVSTRKCFWTFNGHDGTVRDVVFSLDGNLVISCSEDKTIKL